MEEIYRSHPDIIVYSPGSDNDTDNEHFLVFQSPQSGLIALWTQSSCEGYGNNHIVLSRSQDSKQWSAPVIVAGPETTDKDGRQASWQFPVVSKRGRIYLFYLQESDTYDLDRATSGHMGCKYSDDDGYSWSEPELITMPRNRFDHPDSSKPKNWIVWQIPIRDSKGNVLVGYTHWTSPIHYGKPPAGWYSKDSRCRFFRIENIDDNPRPNEIKIDWFENDTRGLEVPFPGRDNVSVCQEPSLALLPDGRIFCTMRTFTGYIYYSISDDDGETWRSPEILREHDSGNPILQPIASCPVYPLQDGRFVLIHHNNDGHIGEYGPEDALHNRRPAFIRVGRFLKSAHQPIVFGPAYQILDTDDVCIGPKQTNEIATYPSLTEYRGERILWYPDRKYFLLGKILSDSDMDPYDPSCMRGVDACGNTSNEEGIR